MEIASRQPSLLTSKHGFITKTKDLGIVSGEKRAREVLQQRLESELVNVRRLLCKAKAAAVRPPPASRVKNNRPLPFLAEEPPAKKAKVSPPVPVPAKAAAVRFPPASCVKDSRQGFVAEEPPAKKRKASPAVPVPVPEIKKRNKVTSSEREMLAEDLHLFVAEIPDHIVNLMEKQSCGIRRDEIEIDIHALEDAAVVELQKHIESFAREKKRRANTNPSPPQEQHQDQDEEEEEVDIIGGVSPLKIAPAPLLQLVEEEDEEIDICGGVLPLPIPPATVIPSGSECFSSGSDSDSDSDSDSECTSSSSSNSDSDSEEEEVDIIGGVSPLTIAPAPLLQLVEEDEEDVDICGGVSPLPILPAPVIPCTSSSSPPCSQSSDSDSDSGSECTSSSSDSDYDSDSDEIVDGPAAPAVRASTPPTRELIAGADQSPETQRKEAISKAREKARQEVLETERTAMPNERLHHIKDIKALNIDEYNMTKPSNVLHQIGLFLKVEDDEGLKYLNFEEHLEEGEIWL